MVVYLDTHKYTDTLKEPVRPIAECSSGRGGQSTSMLIASVADYIASQKAVMLAC